jgi:hypothetical protein
LLVVLVVIDAKFGREKPFDVTIPHNYNWKGAETT